MMMIMTKIILSALLITGISEAARHHTFFAALIASVPMISVISLIWIYLQHTNAEKISQLSTDIAWLTLPSLVLFIALPTLLHYRIHFFLSLIIAILLTICAYGMMIMLLKHFGIHL